MCERFLARGLDCFEAIRLPERGILDSWVGPKVFSTVRRGAGTVNKYVEVVDCDRAFCSRIQEVQRTAGSG